MTLSEIFKDIEALIGLDLKQESISFVSKLQDDIAVYGYKNELIQVLLNLITNAKEAILSKEIKDGEIIFEGIKNKEVVELLVSDNAKGIGEDNINKVFEPYFSTENQLNGMGLGLYNAKMVITKHFKGDIQIENTSLGTKVFVAIPIE